VLTRADEEGDGQRALHTAAFDFLSSRHDRKLVIEDVGNG